MKNNKKRFIFITVMLMFFLLSINSLFATEVDKSKSNIGSLKVDGLTKIEDDDFASDILGNEGNNYYLNFNDYIIKQPTTYSSRKGLVTDSPLPGTYNLNNVNGTNYAPDVRNQGKIGTCWAFSVNSVLESYIKRHNITIADNNFSENQLDMAFNYLAEAGEFGPNFTHALGTGGNSYYSTFMWLYGMGPITETEFGLAYTDKYNTIPNDFDLSKVVDSSYSKIDVTEVNFIGYKTSIFGDTPLNNTASLTTQIINPVKNHIMNNGAVYVDIYIPSDFQYNNDDYIYLSNNEASFDSDNNLVVNNGYTAHAVTVIGWDDTYGDIDNADGDNDVTTGGEGAWIAQNSWGDIKTYFYISYYDLAVSDIIFEIKDIKEKDYDYIYNEPTEKYILKSSNSMVDYYYIGDQYQTVNEVKILGFYTSSKNVSINIRDEYGTTCSSNETKTVSNGMYTFTFTDCEVAGKIMIQANNAYDECTFDTFRMNISTNDSSEAITIYKDEALHINNNAFMGYYLNNRANNVLDLTLSFKDTMSFEPYEIIVIDGDTTRELTSEEVDITNSEIVNGIAKAEIKLLKHLDMELITVIVRLNNKDFYIECDYNLIDIDGSGTVSNPYLIEEPEQLIGLKSAFALFRLNNNIDMKQITGDSGLFSEESNGWTPIDFYGNFDGGNHTISNLISKQGGLFDTLGSASITNLGIKGFDIVGDNAYILANTTLNSVIENINVSNTKCISKVNSCYLIENVASNGYSNLNNIKISSSELGTSGTRTTERAGLIDTIYAFYGSELEIANIYIEDTLIYGKGTQYYLLNEIYSAIDGSELVGNTINIDNIKYLPATGSDTNYTYATNDAYSTNNFGAIDCNTYELLNINLLDYGLYISNVNIINSEQSTDVTNFPSFDFTSAGYWKIDTDETPRLSSFDIPTETVALSSQSFNSNTNITFKNNIIRLNPLSGETVLSDVITLSDNDLTLKKYNINGTLGDIDTIPKTGQLISISNDYETLNYELAVLGDVNSDGIVNLQDFRKIAKYIISTDKSSIISKNVQVVSGDINNDDSITLMDFRKVAKYIINGTY